MEIVMTHKIEWDTLIAKSIYQNQEVTEYGNSAFEFEITKSHSWVTESNNGVRNLKPFEDIKNRNVFVFGGGVTNYGEFIERKGSSFALGWIVTDGTIKSYKGELYRASICQSKEENFRMILIICSILNWILQQKSRSLTIENMDGKISIGGIFLRMQRKHFLINVVINLLRIYLGLHVI